MKNYILLLLLSLSLYTSINAQYDFPATINGLSIGLDLSGEQIVFASDFLNTPTDNCSAYGDILINRSTLQFPRGSEPPATASNFVTFTCDDFGTESIELWYQNHFGNWLVADSYVVIFGLQDNCGDCGGDGCESSSPVLYNGLSVSFPVDIENVTVNALELVSRAVLPGETFSFSLNPLDTTRMFYCSGNALVPVLVFSHRDGFTPRSASTYVALATSEDCGNGDLTGAISKVVQGLSIPNSSAEIVTVAAGAFAPRHVASQQLSFSEDPADTLFTLTCEQIGAGGIFVNVFNHVTGTPGPPASTYLTGDDTQNHCGDGPENNAANDNIADAFLVDSCRTFHQFTKASTEEEDMVFPNGGQSVWHRGTYELTGDGGNLEFYIDAVDTLQYALFGLSVIPDTTLFLIDNGIITGQDTLYTGQCIVSNRSILNTENIYLQVSSLREGSLTRYFLSARSFECPSAINEGSIATLRSYPNPTSGLTSIDVPDGLSDRATISIFDQVGRKIQQLTPSGFSNTINLDLSSQPPGIYYLRLSDESKNWVSKIHLTGY